MRTFHCGGCRKKLDLTGCFTQVGLSKVCSNICAVEVRSSKIKPSAPKPFRTKKIRKPDVPLKVRSAVISRDNSRCRFCGKPSSILHHIWYRSQGGKHIEVNLICLCQEHHELMHSNKKYWQPILLKTIEILTKEISVTIPEVERRWPSWS